MMLVEDTLSRMRDLHMYVMYVHRETQRKTVLTLYTGLVCTGVLYCTGCTAYNILAYLSIMGGDIITKTGFKYRLECANN